MVIMRKFYPDKDCRYLFDRIKNNNEEILPAQSQYLNIDEFYNWIREQLKGFYHDFYVFEDNEAENVICGFALSYDYRVYDGHCHIYFHFFEDTNLQILQSFINFMFSEYPLVKIFFETVSTDEIRISLANALGFCIEMRLKEYKYQKGNYEDWYIFSIYPDRRIEGINND